LINNSTPVRRADGGQSLNTGNLTQFRFGKDANSAEKQIFKDMMEKARPNTPLGGSY